MKSWFPADGLQEVTAFHGVLKFSDFVITNPNNIMNAIK